MPQGELFPVSPGPLFTECVPIGQYADLLTSSAGVAPANTARLRLNGGSLQVSISGGAYANLVTGSGGITIGTTTIASGTDTRVLFDDAGTIGETANLTINKTTGALTVGGSLTVAAGTVTAPSLVAAGAPAQSGLYWVTAGSYGGWHHTVAGTDAGYIGITSSGYFAWALGPASASAGPLGAVNIPILQRQGDSDTGLWFPAANTIATTAGGTEGWRQSTTYNTFALPITAPLGAAAAPGINWTGDLTSGLYGDGTGGTYIAVTGALQFRVTAVGGYFPTNCYVSGSYNDSNSRYSISTNALTPSGMALNSFSVQIVETVGTTGTPTALTITQAGNTGGASSCFAITGGTLTGQTTLTETPDVLWDFSRTVTHANGNITVQRSIVFDVQTTHAFTSSSSTVANAAGLHVTSGPTQGTNAVFTSIIGVLLGGDQTGAATTTAQTSATGAKFAQLKLLGDTVAYLGATAMTATPAVSGVFINALTITSDTATLTISSAASCYIANAPIAGTNVTLTKTYSLWIDAGLPRIDSTTANGSVATVLGSVGPTGAQTTVQEWLTLDINGTTRYVPCF